jgi:hypothetical protein
VSLDGRVKPGHDVSGHGPRLSRLLGGVSTANAIRATFVVKIVARLGKAKKFYPPEMQAFAGEPERFAREAQNPNLRRRVVDPFPLAVCWRNFVLVMFFSLR